MKVWITKYALTDGIMEVEATTYPDSPKMVSWGSGYGMYAHGNDWHTTPDSAVKRAYEMKAKKLKSIEASRKRIEKLEFE